MKRWIALAAAAAVVATPAAAFAGGHGKKPGGGHRNKPAKVEVVCHKPGTPAEMTLKVPSSAVPGHLGHGDYLGACKPKTDPTEDPTEEPTDPTPTEEPTEPGPTEEPTEGPTEEPTEEPSEGPSEEPSEGPTDDPTEEPSESTPTEEPSGEPTDDPTGEPTDDPTGEPETPTAAVVAGPTLPSGSIWHDCEIGGWTYDLDATWDDEFTRITFLDPNGHPTNGDDGAREAGPWKAVSSIREGKTYGGLPVRGFAEPLEDGWYVVDTDEDGYVTRIAADFEVEFPWPDEDCASIGEPGGPVLEPGPLQHRQAPDPTPYADGPGTDETLADTGSEVNVLGAVAGAAALAAGLALGYLGLGRRTS